MRSWLVRWCILALLTAFTVGVLTGWIAGPFNTRLDVEIPLWIARAILVAFTVLMAALLAVKPRGVVIEANEITVDRVLKSSTYAVTTTRVTVMTLHAVRWLPAITLVGLTREGRRPGSVIMVNDFSKDDRERLIRMLEDFPG
jgi:hypothetical protein